MKVLVDSSVWVEFFRPRPRVPMEPLAVLLEDDQVVTIWPVYAEIFSGIHRERERFVVRRAFESLEHVDLDWNAKVTWDRLVGFAEVTRRQGIAMPGLIDRMIIAAAQEADAMVWSLDKAVNGLAKALDVPMYVLP